MNPRFLLPTIFGLTLVTATAADYNLLNAAAPAKGLVPTAATPAGWQAEADPANIASWTSGNTGIGYDTDTSGGGNYNPHIGIPVASGTRSVYLRVPFTVNAADLPLLKSLTLRMRFDDGYVAWINGTKVTSVNEPATLAWDSLTLNGASVNANLTGWSDVDISQHLGLLHAGTNMLAIQGLNATAGSTDLLIVPGLLANDVTPPRWPTPAFIEVPGVGQRTRPLGVRNAGDGSNKLYIFEQRGVISYLSAGTLTPFLDINARVMANNDGGGGNEQGLFGLAFPADFAQSRRFYVSYSGAGNALTLSRFRTLAANPAVGDPASEQVLQTIAHTSATNHNGGDIHFGKDGMLYWSAGDGGVQGDPSNNAQNTGLLLGKILRLDVEGQAAGGPLVPTSNPYLAPGDGILDQIYHIGMRNPWRWSFDRDTGDMWVGDVGQDAYEEVTLIPAGTGPANLQWRRKEALHDYNLTSPFSPGTQVAPIVERPRPDNAVIGGYVYRGRGFPSMYGIYFFGDNGSGNFYGVAKDSSGVWRTSTLLTGGASGVTGFGEDEAGELYYASSGGRVYRITDSASDSAFLKIVSHTVNPANGRVTFTWGAANGRNYVPEVSTNMNTWTAAGPTQTGGATFRLTFSETSDPPAGTGRRYFRAREL